MKIKNYLKYKKAVIKKSCHAELGSVSRIFGKKAAMFGLDARITLAIFGALSVITGASLYSVLGKTETVKTISNLNELGKAFEQYYLDTGKLLPRHTSDTSSYHYYLLDSGNLLVNLKNVSNWKGPYIKDYQPSEMYLHYPNASNIHFMQLDTGKSIGSGGWTVTPCTSGKTCAIWICISGNKDAGLLEKLDKYIDNNDGKDTGDLQWYQRSDTYELYYYYMPIQNPHG